MDVITAARQRLPVHGWARRLTTAFLTISVWLSPLAYALDAKKPVADFLHQTWTVDQGLPHSTVRGIAQSPDGYLWFGTHEGAARFDGRNFTVFNEGTTPALLGTGIASLLTLKDGTLLFGMRDGGLVRLRDGVFSPHAERNKIPPGSITTLKELSDGTLWVGSSTGGLARLQASGAGSGGDAVDSRLYTVALGLPSDAITALAVSASGDVWVGTTRGLVQIRGGQVVQNPTGSPLDRATVNAIAIDKSGATWVATTGLGLWQLRGMKATQLTTRDGLASQSVMRLMLDSRQSLWVGTVEGLQRYRDGRFETLNAALGLTNNFVRELYQDQEGSIWIGTDRGIDRLRDSHITTIGVRQGLSEEFTRTVFEDRSNRVWIGTADGLFRYDENGVKRFGREHGLLTAAVLSIAQSPDGTLWVGTHSGGLHRMVGDRFVKNEELAKLSGASVRAILPASDGVMWIGTNNGLWRWSPRGSPSGASASSMEPLGSDQIHALYEDAAKRVWVGARGGLGVVDGNTIKPVGQSLSIPGGVLAINGEPESQRLWVSTNGGLALVREQVGNKAGGGTVFTGFVFRAAHGVPEQTYFNALVDGESAIWLCSNRGVLQLDRRALVQIAGAAEGPPPATKPRWYGLSDGMATVQCNGASQPAGWRRRDGTLLMPTARGVTVLNPSAKSGTNRRPPPVHVRQVSINGFPTTAPTQSPAAEVELPAGKSRVEIEYVGLSMIDPDKVRYRYRLDGFDRDWVDAGNENKAVYTNLAPGDYKFKVLAANNDGVWNETGATLSVRQMAFFYQTVWFRAACAIALFLTLVIAYRQRVVSLQKHRARLTELVEDRTRELALQTERLTVANDEKSRLIERVEQQARAYELLSKQDSLTGLGNRRELDRLLHVEFARARRRDRPLCVAICDIDHFKQINDQHSHAIGDLVLRRIAVLLRDGCRTIDSVLRYGGEEFVIVLPDTELADAAMLCERLRTTIEGNDWSPIQHDLKVTMSFGVVTLAGHLDESSLLLSADENLYRAKREGRNRVVSSV